MISFTRACKLSGVSRSTVADWKNIFPEFFICNSDKEYNEELLEIIKTIKSLKDLKQSNEEIRSTLSDIFPAVFDMEEVIKESEETNVLDLSKEINTLTTALSIVAKQKSQIDMLTNIAAEFIEYRKQTEENIRDLIEKAEEDKLELKETLENNIKDNDGRIKALEEAVMQKRKKLFGLF